MWHETYLFIQTKLCKLLPLARFWHPNLHAELFDGKGLSKQHLCETGFQEDCWETRGPAASTQVLDHGVGVVRVLGDEQGIGAVYGVVFVAPCAVKKTQGARLW